MSGHPIGPGSGSADLEAALRDLGACLDLGPAATREGRTAFVTAVLDRLDDRALSDRDDVDRDDVDHDDVDHDDGDGRGGVHRGEARDHRDNEHWDDDARTIGSTSGLPVDAPIDLVSTSRRRLTRRVLAAAAVALVVLAGLLAVTPTREAIARWLGVGAVSITNTNVLPPEGLNPAPGAPTDDGRPPESGSIDLDAVARELPFPVRLPDPAVTGELLDAEVDASVPVGLVELRFDGVTIVEIGSQRDTPPVIAKVVGPGTVTTSVTVVGRPGFWLTGEPHRVASTDPDGTVRLDTVRQAGDVLIWEDGGVTYRIEGAPTLGDAQAIAASLR